MNDGQDGVQPLIVFVLLISFSRLFRSDFNNIDRKENQQYC